MITCLKMGVESLICQGGFPVSCSHRHCAARDSKVSPLANRMIGLNDKRAARVRILSLSLLRELGSISDFASLMLDIGAHKNSQRDAGTSPQLPAIAISREEHRLMAAPRCRQTISNPQSTSSSASRCVCVCVHLRFQRCKMQDYMIICLDCSDQGRAGRMFR